MTPEGLKELAQLMLAIGAGANFGLWQKSANAAAFVFCIVMLIWMWV